MSNFIKTRTIKFNFIMNLLLTVSNFLFPLITFPYVSRILTPVGTGKVAFAYSIVSYFSIFAAFGVANYGIRACALVRDDKDKLSKTVHEILAINIFLMCFVYLLFFLGVYFIPELKEEKNLFFISGLNILFSILSVEWLYKGIEQYFYITIRSIFFKLLSFILIFIFIKSPSDYGFYAFILIFASVGSGVINIYNLRKLIFLKFFKNYEFKKHINAMTVFFVIAIAVSIYVHVSVIMLGFMKGNVEVGYYNAAYRIKDLMVGIITSLGAVLLPRLSYYIEHSMRYKFNDILEKSMQFIFVLALPLVIFCIFFAEPSILLLAGIEYKGAIYPLKILSFVVFIVGVSNLTGIQMLIPLNNEKNLCYSVVIAAIVNIILNVILIPYYGASGAAISVVIAEACILIYQLFVLREYIPILFGNIKFMRILLSLFFATSLSIFIQELIMYNKLMAFIISSFIFFICYFLMLFLFKEPFVFYVLNQIKFKLIK